MLCLLYMKDYLTFSRWSFYAFCAIPLDHTWNLMNYSFSILCFNLGKIAMHTTKGRHLFLAKCHCLITEQILMRGMDHHKTRCYAVSLWQWTSIYVFFLLTLCLNYGQIKMSNETERRVENLLSRAQSNNNASASTSTVSMRQSLPSTSTAVAESTTYVDKQKLSFQLRDMQRSKKVSPVIF